MCLRSCRRLQATARATDDIEKLDQDPIAKLDPPSSAEILQAAGPGDVHYAWQYEDVLPQPEAAATTVWRNLPHCLSRLLDREYAAYLHPHKDAPPPKATSTVVVHVTFRHEMKKSWVLDNTRVQPTGGRQLTPTPKGKPRKNYLLVNFDRDALKLDFDYRAPCRVRCAKISYDSQTIIEQADLAALLRERLQPYMGGGNSEDQREQARLFFSQGIYTL